MPIVGGPVGVLLVAGAAVVALVAWLVQDRRPPGPRLVGDETGGIDREALEQAEREVRDLAAHKGPGDEFPRCGWGREGPRPPELL